jgi:hypothetical protein
MSPLEEPLGIHLPPWPLSRFGRQVVGALLACLDQRPVDCLEAMRARRELPTGDHVDRPFGRSALGVIVGLVVAGDCCVRACLRHVEVALSVTAGDKLSPPGCRIKKALNVSARLF